MPCQHILTICPLVVIFFCPKFPQLLFGCFFKRFHATFPFCMFVIQRLLLLKLEVWQAWSLFVCCTIWINLDKEHVFFILSKSSIGRDFCFMKKYLYFSSMALASTLSPTINKCHIIWTSIKKYGHGFMNLKSCPFKTIGEQPQLTLL